MKAIDSQNICVKVYFTGWQEQFLQDDKNNQNHHDLFYFTTASIVKFKLNYFISSPIMDFWNKGTLNCFKNSNLKDDFAGNGQERLFIFVQ